MILRRAYPNGLPDGDYMPLLAAMSLSYSARNLAMLIADFLGEEDVVVANDAAAAVTARRPYAEDIDRVTARLERHGWHRG
jgi:hypothetical protein